MKGYMNLWILYIAAIAVAAYFMYINGIFPAAITGCQDVFCNDYDFMCCDYVKTSGNNPYVINYGWPIQLQDATPFTCNADMCYVNSGTANYYYINNICTFVNYPYEMQRGQVLGYPMTSLCQAMPTSNIIYETWNQQVKWCGNSACGSGLSGLIGVTVPGADGCTFVTDSSIYNNAGELITNPDENQISYIVPLGECLLVRGSRTVCGNTCESCGTSSDCVVGHSFVYNGQGAECTMNRLQLYGCSSYGSVPSSNDLNIFPWETTGYYQYGSRCEVVSEQNVQCCPGTNTCGSNGFCDPNTFTCRTTAECTYDWNCGTAPVYDQATHTIRTPKCTAGSCTFSSVTVGCFYNSECPSGWYCSGPPDYACRESTAPKVACPNTCCVGDARYFDRPCAGTDVCCPGGGECAATLEQCTAGGGGSGGWISIILAFIIAFAITFVVSFFALMLFARGFMTPTIAALIALMLALCVAVLASGIMSLIADL